MHPIYILTGSKEVWSVPLVAWSESYNVNVRRFDEQHRRLLDMVNRLDEVLAARKGLPIEADALTSLAAYLQTHFVDEERLMRHHVFPGFVLHKRAHDRMLDQVRNFRREMVVDENPISRGIVIFLREWLVQHIRVEDAKYGPFMNGKGVA